MDTPLPPRRRRFSPDFKARILEACARPDASIADIARQHDLTPDRIRRWQRGLGVSKVSSAANAATGFLPVRITPPVAAPAAVRIEVHRGDTLIKIDCPAACTGWLKDWLR